MADQDSAPLSAEEREELEALREEKARREREERDRRERAELEALRAEQKQVDDEILAERAASGGTRSASGGSHVTPNGVAPAVPHDANGAHHKPDHQHADSLTFGQKMVMTPEAKDEDDVPGMAPAQKIVILLALVFVILGVIYVVTR